MPEFLYGIRHPYRNDILPAAATTSLPPNSSTADLVTSLDHLVTSSKLVTGCNCSLSQLGLSEAGEDPGGTGEQASCIVCFLYIFIKIKTKLHKGQKNTKTAEGKTFFAIFPLS